MSERTTLVHVTHVAKLLSRELGNIPLDIDQGSRVNGRSWAIRDGGHVIASGRTADEVQRVANGVLEGLYLARRAPSPVDATLDAARLRIGLKLPTDDGDYAAGRR